MISATATVGTFIVGGIIGDFIVSLFTNEGRRE